MQNMINSSNSVKKQPKNIMNFGPMEYIVSRIDGDYAYLQQVDNPKEELKCVARALLPEEITEGTQLHYEMMEYRIEK